MGIELESSDDGSDAFVVSSGRPEIFPGHILVAVNDKALEGRTFDEILGIVGEASWPRKLSFSNVTRNVQGASNNLPLPDGFFSEFTGFTADEEAEIQNIMQEKLAEMVNYAQTSPESNGLTKSLESGGCEVYLGDKLDSENEKVQLILSKIKVPISAEFIMNACLTADRKSYVKLFSMIDQMFADGYVLGTIPSNFDKYGGAGARPDRLKLPLYTLKWGCWKIPFPLYDRDFVFCECTTRMEDGTGASLCMTIPKFSNRIRNLEESHKIIRGHMGMSGFVFKDTAGTDPYKPAGTNSMSTDITYMVQINVKGSLPRWAVNLAGPLQGLNVKAIRDYAMIQRDLTMLLFDVEQQLNGFEVLTAVASKGTFVTSKLFVKEGFECVYRWITEEHDITFSVSGPDGEVVVPPTSHTCTMGNKTPCAGRFLAANTGEYEFKWDNSSSWFTSKKVHYHQVSIDPADPLPWRQWGSLADALAVE